MNSNSQLVRLERALTKRNPRLLGILNPGIKKSLIKNLLSRSTIAGETEPIYRMYSWRDGTGVARPYTLEYLSFFPCELFTLLNLRTAVLHMEMWTEAAQYNPKLSQGVGRCFPLFYDGATDYLALDTMPGYNGRIINFEYESDEPFRVVYTSFDEFLEDAIQANEIGKPLKCAEYKWKSIVPFR